MRRSSPLNDKIGANLKTIREKAGISQRQMAEGLGLNQTRVSLIENGSHYIRAVEMLNWCKIAHTDPADFVRDLFKQ